MLKRMLKRAACLLLIGAALPIWAAEAPLTADTYVSSAGPSANFGLMENVLVGSGNVGLLAFDVSGFSAGTTVTNAWLHLFVNSVPAGGALTFTVVNSSWSESAVNRNIEPSVASTSFASIAASTANAYVTIDVTTQVQAWITTPSVNFGIEITALPGVLVALDARENTHTSHPALLDVVVLAGGGAGPQGAVGRDGGVGATGAIGPAGPVGPTGSAGPAGAQGSTGPAGATGSVGAAGSVGPAGPTGSAGTTGAVGPTGPAGPAGAVGATGAAGVQGSVGATGAVGATGTAGPVGVAGTTGSAGSTGAAGTVAGAKGATGPVGASGQQGAQGTQGVQGPAGVAGASGATGAAGASGANGPSGSVFQMDTTAHAGTYTIPDADSNIFYIGDNSSAVAAFKLPKGQAAGRRLVIVEKVASSVSPGLTVNTQSTDTLVTDTSGTATVLSANSVIELFCDGTGHWYVTYYQ